MGYKPPFYLYYKFITVIVHLTEFLALHDIQGEGFCCVYAGNLGASAERINIEKNYGLFIQIMYLIVTI